MPDRRITDEELAQQAGYGGSTAVDKAAGRAASNGRTATSYTRNEYANRGKVSTAKAAKSAGKREPSRRLGDRDSTWQPYIPAGTPDKVAIAYEYATKSKGLSVMDWYRQATARRNNAQQRIDDLQRKIDSAKTRQSEWQSMGSAFGAVEPDDDIETLTQQLAAAQRVYDKADEDFGYASLWKDYDDSRTQTIGDSSWLDAQVERSGSYANVYAGMNSGIDTLNQQRLNLEQQLSTAQKKQAAARANMGDPGQYDAEIQEIKGKLQEINGHISTAERRRDLAHGMLLQDYDAEDAVAAGKLETEQADEQFTKERQGWTEEDWNAWQNNTNNGLGIFDKNYQPQAVTTKAIRPTDAWTDEERSTFYLMRKKFGAEEADRYAAGLNRAYNQKRVQEQTASVREWAAGDADGFVGDLGKMLGAPAGTAAQVASTMTGAKTISWLDKLNSVKMNGGYYTGPREGLFGGARLVDYADALAQGKAEQLNEKYGTLGGDIPILGGKGLGDLYQLGNSIMQSMASGNILGEAGTLFMFFGQAADSGFDEAIQRGASPDQAAMYSVLSGAAEVAGEKFSLENLLDPTKNLIKQGFIEGSEEGFTDLLNLFNDYLSAKVTGGHTEIAQKLAEYMSQGMSYEEASKLVWKETASDVAWDVVGGFVSGSASGGAQSVVREVTPYRANNAGQTAYGADTAQLAQEALDAARAGGEVDRKLQQRAERAQKRSDAGKTISVAEAGRLVKGTNRASMVDAVENQIKSRGEGIDGKTGRSLANAVVAQARSEKLSKNQQKLVEQHKDLAGALVKELDINKPAAWAQEIGVRGAKEEVEAYGNRSARNLEQDLKSTKDAMNVRVKGEQGTIVDAVRDSKGEVTAYKVQNSSGNVTEVKAADVSMREGQKAVADYMTGGAYAAEKIKAMENGQDPRTYSVDFDIAADVFGNSNTYDTFDKAWGAMQKMGTSLTKDQARAAWAAGQMQKAGSGKTTLQRRGTGAVSFDSFNDGKTNYDKPSAEDIEAFKQTARYQVLTDIAKAIGIDLSFFKAGSSQVNGMYQNGTVYLNMDASYSSKETVDNYVMLTAAHELTHYIREAAPAQYAELKDFVVKHIIEKGMLPNGNTLAEQIRHKLDVYNGSITVDDAVEEIVADACQMMLKDNKLIATMAAENQELHGKISKWMQKFFRKLANAFRGISTASAGSTEARAMEDAFNELQEIWNKGLSAAAQAEVDTEAHEAEVDQRVAEGKAITPEDENKYSLRFDDKLMTDAVAMNNKTHAVSDKVMLQAQRARQYIAGEFMSEERDLNLPADVMGNTFLPDASYGGTMENTTVCIRSLAAQALMDQISKKLGRPMTVDETLMLSQEIANWTDKPECFYCYVATDRRAYREFLGNYDQQRQEVLEKAAKLSDEERQAILDMGKAPKKANRKSGAKNLPPLYKEFLNGRADTNNMRDRIKLWVGTPQANLISSSDLASLDELAKELSELEQIKDKTPAQESRYAQLKDAAGYAQSASWAKKNMGYTAYDGKILSFSDEKVKSFNDHYGLRMYSFSDFSAAFILENMQMITDAAARGLKMLAYTKEMAFAEIFASTGININISVYASMDNGQIIRDEMMGANWERAIALREKFNNVGLTLVATNDEIVKWGMEQPYVDVIIPYHLVRTGKAVADYFGFTNYTSESADGKILKAKEYKGKVTSISPTMHNNDVVQYARALQEHKLTPRFGRWLNGFDDFINGNMTEADFRAANPNYMKLVNETRQTAGETNPVQPVFNVAAALTAIDEMEARGGYGIAEILGPSYQSTMKEISNKVVGQIQGRKLSLKEFDDGRKFVDVETDQAQFDGLTSEEQAALAKKIIIRRFSGKVIGVNNTAFVNRSGAEEYGYPAKFITNPDVKEAKMRASTELDNLVEAGTNFRTEPDGRDGHVHPDAVGGFSYFDTLFKVGNEYYEGTINIINNRRGRLFKDVTQIKNVTKDIMASYGANPRYQFLSDTSMNNISDGKRSVKDDDIYIPYNRRAVVSEDTLDLWMDGSHFGASNPNYAQAYIAYMRPGDYLDLTTIFDLGRIREETEDLDADKLKATVQQQPIQLEINTETGEVEGHEGRHRMVALSRAGISEVPVLLFDSRNKYSKTPIESIMLRGQEFNGTRNPARATVLDLVPLNQAHRQEIVDRFSKQEPFERSAEKIGIRQTMRFSVKDETDVTDRELLANTLYSVVKNPAEKTRLTNYKKRLDEFYETRDKLTEAEAALREARHIGNKEAIRKAQAERDKLNAKLIQIDSKLTELELTRPLKELLTRVRQDTRTRQRAMTAERRSKTDLRHKIRNLHSYMSNQLLQPKENRYVPKPLLRSVAELLEAVNTDTGRSETVKAKLAELNAQYAKIKDSNDYGYAFDDTVQEMLQKLTEELAGMDNTSIYKMSQDQLQLVYDTMKAINHTVRTAVKLINYETNKNIFEIAKGMMQETDSASPVNLEMFNKWLNASLRPETFFKRMAGYRKDSNWNMMADMLNTAQRKQTQIQMEGTAIFEELMKDTKALDAMTDHKKLYDIGLKDKNGDAVPVTMDMALMIYLHTLNEQNVRHLVYGGLTVPDMKKYYNGKASESYSKNVRVYAYGPQLAELGRAMREAETQEEKDEIQAKIDEIEAQANDWIFAVRQKIEDQMGDYEKSWVKAAQKFFNEYSQRVLNETTMAVYGFEKATVENYAPIHTDAAYRTATFDSISRDMSLENSGFMKARVINAANPMLAEGLVDVVAMQIDNVAKYAAMMPAVRNFTKVYGKSASGYTGSIQESVRSKFGTSAQKYIENIITDLTSPRRTEGGMLGEFADKLRGNLAQASLTLNPRVTLGQAASYPTAAAVVGWKPLIKALKEVGSNPMYNEEARQEIAKWSPLLWYRMQGFFDQSVGEGRESWSGKLMDKAKFLTGWIEAVDGWTVGQLWYAAQEYVDDTTSLERGSDAFMEETAKVFNKIVEQTQPNYTTFQRPDILRNPNAVVKQLTMFMTQRLQNVNILFDAVGEYNAAVKDFKAGGKYGTTEQDLKKAKLGVARAVTSQLAAAATITAFKLLADALMYTMKGYRDDDKELTGKSIILQLLQNGLESLASNFLWGSELFAIAKSLITGERYYGISLNGVDTFNKFLTDAVGLRQDLSAESLWKLCKDAAQVVGIPLPNLAKFYNAVAFRINDAKNGEGWGTYASEIQLKDEDRGRQLYNALVNGNDEKAKKIYEYYGNKGDANEQVAKHIKKLFQDDELTGPEAEAALQKYADMSAYDSSLAISKLSCEKDTGIKYDDIKSEYLEGNISQDKAVEMRAKYGMYEEDEAAATVQEWKMKKDTGLDYENMPNYIAAGDITKEQAIKYRMEYGGQDEDAATKTVSKWMCEIETGMPYSKIEEYYADGTITKDTLIEYYQKYGLYDEEKAEQVADKREFIGTDDALEDASIAAVAGYYGYCDDADVDKRIYLDAYQACYAIRADKDSKGKTINGSALKKKLSYIDGLDLAPYQKTAVALAIGLTDKQMKKWKAPWL